MLLYFPKVLVKYSRNGGGVSRKAPGSWEGDVLFGIKYAPKNFSVH